jgi:hypothetical protein
MGGAVGFDPVYMRLPKRRSFLRGLPQCCQRASPALPSGEQSAAEDDPLCGEIDWERLDITVQCIERPDENGGIILTAKDDFGGVHVRRLASGGTVPKVRFAQFHSSHRAEETNVSDWQAHPCGRRLHLASTAMWSLLLEADYSKEARQRKLILWLGERLGLSVSGS